MANREVLLEMKLTKLAQRRARGKQFRGAVGSGLIGGAFPLLFGQGPGAAAGGALGGAMGGQGGGQGDPPLGNEGPKDGGGGNPP